MPAPADATAYRVQARTEASAYPIRTYRGTDRANPTVLPRRRIVQYLSADVFEIANHQDLGFESNLRVFSDFGVTANEANRVDGLHGSGVELLTAQLDVRRPALEARLGRQSYVDVMDYMAFDGARVKVRSPLGVGAEAYAGLWVKPGSLAGTAAYQPEGTRETDARRLGLGVASAEPELDDLEPLVGAKLLWDGAGRGVSGSAGYRRAVLAGKTDLERAAAEVRWRNAFGFGLFAGADYDLYGAKLAQARALVRFDRARAGGSVEALRLSPVFSSDSIFGYFATAPRDEVRIRGDLRPVGPFDFYLQLVGAESEMPAGASANLTAVLRDRATPSSRSLGPEGGVGWKGRRFHAGADASFRGGDGSAQTWVEATAGYRGAEGRHTIDGRLSVVNLAGNFEQLWRGTYVGAQVWGGTELARFLRASVVLEDNVNAAIASEIRIFLVLELKAVQR